MKNSVYVISSNCLYVPNSDCVKTRTSITGVTNVMANAAIRPDINVKAGLNVDSSDDMCILRIHGIADTFCGRGQTGQKVGPPCIREAARKTAHDKSDKRQL